MITVEELEDTWEILSAVGGSRQELRVRQLGDPSSPGSEVLFALDAENRRHVLIEVEDGHSVIEDRRSSGVHVVRHRLLDAGRPRVFVDVQCRKTHLNAAFSQLVCEVLSIRRRDRKRPDEICGDVLQRWRDLLERALPTTLTPQRLVGLFGELWIVREIVRHDRRAFGCWKGPFGSQHDFTRDRMALEVKATTGRTWTCHVSGLDQLVPPRAGALFLALLHFDAGDEGESLSTLVDDIVAAGVSRSTLVSTLEMIGVTPGALDDQTLRYRLLERRIYQVRSTFPRLVPADLVDGRLRAGVFRLSYELDLSDDSIAYLDEDQRDHMLARMAGTTR
jgi:hypothetical protein